MSIKKIKKVEFDFPFTGPHPVQDDPAVDISDRGENEKSDGDNGFIEFLWRDFSIPIDMIDDESEEELEEFDRELKLIAEEFNRLTGKPFIDTDDDGVGKTDSASRELKSSNHSEMHWHL
jgi:hypothetical protein